MDKSGRQGGGGGCTPARQHDVLASQTASAVNNISCSTTVRGQGDKSHQAASLHVGGSGAEYASRTTTPRWSHPPPISPKPYLFGGYQTRVHP